MRFTYTPTFADYWTLNRRVLARQFGKLLWFAGASFLAYCSLPVLPLSFGPNESVADIYRSGAALLILPGIIVFGYIATYFTGKRRWRDAAEIRSARTYEIDEKGIRVTGDAFSGFLEWRLFKSVEFSSGLVFMKTGQNQYFYFPESLLPDRKLLRDFASSGMSDKPAPRRWFGVPIYIVVLASIVAVLLALFFIPAGAK
jgi:hypothetical protein